MVNIIFLVILLSVLFSTLAAGIIGHFAPKKIQVKDQEERELEKVESVTEKQRETGEEKLLETVESEF